MNITLRKINRFVDNSKKNACRTKSFDFQLQSSNRVGDDCVSHRCSECGVLLEEYSDEEIGIMVIALGTFIHREAAIAAPFLPEILTIVTKLDIFVYSQIVTIANLITFPQIRHAFNISLATNQFNQLFTRWITVGSSSVYSMCSASVSSQWNFRTNVSNSSRWYVNFFQLHVN